MVWFLIVLMASSIIFIVSAVANYKVELAESQDTIRNLTKQTRLLEKRVVRDHEAIGLKRSFLDDLSGTANEMKQEIFSLDTRLKMALKEANDLEMKMYKQEFKKSKERTS